MSTTHVLCAMLDVRGCRAELHVNGFPMARLGPDGIVGTSMPVQQYLVPGTNELELLIEPGERPSTARTGKRELDRQGATATARLMRFPDGAVPEVGNGELLCEVAWEGALGPADGQPQGLSSATTFPRSVARRLELGPMAGSWSWQSAPLLVMGPELVDEARAVLETIGHVLRSGSAPAYSALVEEVTREALRAYPVLTEQGVRQEHETFVSYYSRSGRPVLPLDRERHDFRLVAGGRVLDCVDEDFTPSLRLRDPAAGVALPFSMLLARIDGSLRVVR